MPTRIIPEIPGYNKVDAISFMEMKLKSNDVWVKRACLILYEQQTRLEQKNHISRGRNNVGFGRNDSPLLSKIACKLIQHRETPEDIERLHKKIPRYARQLIYLAYKKDECKSLKRHLDFYYKDSKNNMPF
jgi:hypothetical protein